MCPKMRGNEPEGEVPPVEETFSQGVEQAVDLQLGKRLAELWARQDVLLPMLPAQEILP